MRRDGWPSRRHLRAFGACFLSSVKATSERSLPGRPLCVADIPSPGETKGISKLEAEQALKEVTARTGLEIVIVWPEEVLDAVSVES